MSPTRKPVWSGSFYPATGDELRSEIVSLASPTISPSQKRLRSIIMPHAGYIFSGQTASYAQADIEKMHPEEVIILGPDHHVGMETCHLSTKTAYETPLGTVPLSARGTLLRDQYPELFQHHEISDQKEHSIEVIVPFLQTWLDDFLLLPIVTTHVDPTKMAGAITPLLTKNTLLVISSDLSHFLSDSDCRAKDKQTIEAILNLDLHYFTTNDNKACGLVGIYLLISIAIALNWQPRLLHYANSGETSGDTERVVGYATIGFYEN